MNIAATMSETARSLTQIAAVNLLNTSVSVEEFYDEAFQAALKFMESHPDAVIVARFDHTDLDAFRCLVSAPVNGIGEEIKKYIEEDHSETIVLGCAGITNLAQPLEEAFGLPVLDGVACAVTIREALMCNWAVKRQRSGLRLPEK